MPLPRKIQLNVLVVMWSAFACKSNQPVSQVSGNQVTDRTEGATLLPCERNEPTKLPKAKAYLQRLMEYVARRNPETFSNLFAIENFCISAHLSGEVNASANTLHRSVTFETGLLKKADSDAEVAAVLSHELAHVARRHKTGGTIAREDQPAIRERQAEIPRLRILQRDLSNLEVKQAMQLGTLVRERLVRAKAGPDSTVIVQDLQELEDILTQVRLILSEQGSRPDPDVAVSDGVVDGVPGLPAGPPVAPLRLPEWSLGDASVPDQEFNGQIVRAREAFNEIRGRVLFRVAAAHSAEENKAFDDLANALSETRQRLAKVQKDLPALEMQIRAIEGAQTSPEEAANWIEREADEFGLVYFRRAGFPDYNFAWVQALNALPPESSRQRPQSIDDYDQVLKECVAASQAEGRANGVEPERGLISHPSPCWRLYNARIRQPLSDLRAATAPERTSATFISEPSLKEVLAEIEQAEKNANAPREPTQLENSVPPANEATNGGS